MTALIVDQPVEAAMALEVHSLSNQALRVTRQVERDGDSGLLEVEMALSSRVDSLLMTVVFGGVVVPYAEVTR